MKITKRKVKGVLADMIANMDEDSLAKTREKMEGITEDYCSQEVVKLLKEKGFKIQQYYNSLIGIWQDVRVTHQMAMKWLREVRGLFVDISFVIDEHRGRQVCWYYAIFELYNEAHYNNVDEFPTYEDAVEAALKYAIKNLI